VTALHELLTGSAGEQLRQGVASFSDLLQRMSDPDGPLARTVAELPPLVQGLGATARAMPELVTRLAALAQASEGLVAATRDLVGKSDTRLLAVVDDVGRLTVSLRKVADQGSALLAENRDGIKDFTDSGLPQLTGLVEDATRMVNELNGAIRDMRQDPARFFLGNRDRQGVRLQ
jgi:phospholipid/cholesterol/gamma-HCH transport system substrate-binding protein